MDKRFENNMVDIVGMIVSHPEFRYEKFGEKFCTFNIVSKRLSGYEDIIPVIVPEWMTSDRDYCGRKARVTGQLRSFNRHEGEKNHLVLSVHANEIEEIDNGKDDFNKNEITLDGFICKSPIYRETPMGREIADVLLAVNRSYGKSDYIPCLFWGNNAKHVYTLGVGAHIKVYGRIQSREYVKRLSETESETRVAYEVSVNRFEVEEEKEDAD